VINGLWEIIRRFLNLVLMGVGVIIFVPIAIVGLTIEKALRVIHIIRIKSKKHG